MQMMHENGLKLNARTSRIIKCNSTCGVASDIKMNKIVSEFLPNIFENQYIIDSKVWLHFLYI